MIEMIPDSLYYIRYSQDWLWLKETFWGLNPTITASAALILIIYGIYRTVFGPQRKD